MAAADKTITVTNSRTAPTPTGLLLDAAPYGAMLLAAVVALIVANTGAACCCVNVVTATNNAAGGKTGAVG